MQEERFCWRAATGVPDYAQCFEAIVKPAATGLIWYRLSGFRASDERVWSYGSQKIDAPVLVALLWRATIISDYLL